MKLLSPKELGQDKASETVRELLRSEEIKKQADKIRKDLATAESDFRLALVRNREAWATEEETHKELVTERTAEVEALEARRVQALVPVEVLQKQAQTKLAEAEALSQSLDQEREAVENLQETLEDRLDELGQREIDLKQKSALIEAKESGVNLQAEQVKDSVKSLNLRASDLLAQTNKVSEVLTRRRIENSLIEANLLTRSELLEEKVKKLTRWATNIHEAEVEVEAKRKELMRPVEDILEEAKQNKVQSEELLARAGRDKQKAQELVKQATADYQSRLQELDERDRELSKAELISKNFRSELQEKSRLLHKRDSDLGGKETELAKQQAKLATDLETFQNYMAEEHQKLRDQMDFSQEQLDQAHEALKLSERKEASAEALLNQVKSEKEVISTLHVKVKDKEAKLVKLIKDELVSKADADASLQDLDEERENFALWRLEAEKTVTDHAFENKTLKKLLAQKEEKLKRQEKFLAKLDKKLKDDQGRLSRAWAELDRKRISPR